MLFLPLLLLTSAASHGAQEPAATQPEQELSIAHLRLTFGPQGFDPVQSTQMIDAVMQRQILETLTEYNYLSSTGTIQGLLAESWEVSEDKLSWTFTLRENAAFYDPFEPPLWPSRQRLLVAQDVLYSWLRMADARNTSAGFWAMDGVFRGLNEFRKRTAALDPAIADAAFADAMEHGLEGIQVLDRHRLKLQLLEPDPDFLQRLAMTHFEVYPQEAVLAKGRGMRDQPVGSAGFMLQEWLEGQTIILARTPHWRGQESPFGDGTLPFLDQVEFHVVRDTQNAIQQFKDGSFDRLSLGSQGVSHFLDKDFQIQKDFEDKNYQLFDRDGSDVTMLCFGMKDPVVGNVRGDDEGNEKRRLLRQAIALCFPHKVWSTNVRGAAPAFSAKTFLPPVIPKSQEFPPSDLVVTDLVRARKLLVQAGYPGGKGLPSIELLAYQDENSQSVALFFQATLAQIGIRLEFLPLPHHEQMERERSGQAQVFLRAWVLDWPDASLILQTFFGPLAGTDTNLSNFRNQDFDQLYREMKVMQDSPERQIIIGKMLAILNHETPGIPIDHRRSWILTQPWFSNYWPHPFEPIATKYFRVAPH
ncbi:MAG: ABC transporter substrate-binding protein [Planctomycetota bacterium]